MAHESLTPAQAERLEMLAEEAAEVIQAVTKILRYGYNNYHPHDPHGPNNRDMLREEMMELAAVYWAMGDMEDLYANWFSGLQHNWKRKLKYTHHQEVAS